MQPSWELPINVIWSTNLKKMTLLITVSLFQGRVKRKLKKRKLSMGKKLTSRTLLPSTTRSNGPCSTTPPDCVSCRDPLSRKLYKVFHPDPPNWDDLGFHNLSKKESRPLWDQETLHHLLLQQQEEAPLLLEEQGEGSSSRLTKTR